MTLVDDIKAKTDIVEVVGAYVKLQRAGRLFKGLSPFKNERTPSFFIYPDSQIFVDYSSGEKGDVISFVMKKEGLTFNEAVRELARRAGIQLEVRTEEQKKSESREQRLRDACAAAADYFHRLLLSAPQAGNCRKYIREQRKLADATISAWQMGYSLASYDALMTHLAERGFAADEMIDAGLVIQNEEGRRYDRFRGRLMIPIRDERGRVVGFGSRSLDGSEPKYMNSPQSIVFDKGRLLFGLDRARQAIRTQQHSVIVEGYMDVIGTHQAGFANVVAGMGTALTEDQFKMLKRLSDRIVLALDPDAAGNRAVLRGVDVARGTLDREAEITFHPRGYIRNESKLKADMRVALLPPDKDPDEVVQESAEAWRTIIANAKPVVEHVIDVMLASHDIGDPKGKSDAVNAVAPILRDLSDPVQRDHYAQHLARKLRLNPRAVAQAIGMAPHADNAREAAREAARARPATQPPGSGPGAAERGAAPKAAARSGDLETHLVAVLSLKPHLLMDMNVALTRANLEVLDPDDFANAAMRQGFAQLSRSAMGAPAAAPKEGDDDWLSLIGEYDIEADGGGAPVDEARLREEGIRVALRLREENLRREHDATMSMTQAAQEDHDPDQAKRYNLKLRDLAAKRLRAQKALRLRSGLSVGDA